MGLASAASRIVVVGCGRQGCWVAAQLERAGFSVAVVDRDARALAALPADVADPCCVGDALELDALEQTLVSEARFLLATTASDQRNVAVAAIGLACGARRAIARVRDPRSVRSFGRLGVEIVCPTVLEATALIRRVEEIARIDLAAGGVNGARPVGCLRIVVAGCGRLGAHLVRSLWREGHEVAGLDVDPAALEELRAGAFEGRLVEGDATEPSALRRAGVEGADLLVVAIRDDDVSLMAALAAHRLLGVEKVVARVCDPEREALFRGLGLATVCPTVLGGEAILGLLGRDVAAPAGPASSGGGRA
jgi:trk system potassium uptake protein TrkA